MEVKKSLAIKKHNPTLGCDLVYITSMKISQQKLILLITLQASIATVASLYYGRFWDPALNMISGQRFHRANGLEPCDICWFARILMYPIVILGLVALRRKYYDMTAILILSGMWIILETYQYRFQMTHSNTEIKSVICGVWAEASCAATDVMYRGFVTIPLLCLIAFIVIWILASIVQYRENFKIVASQAISEFRSVL